jgi:hypothetical protein
MKILYAASNNQNAKIQLSRFLTAMVGSDHQIKVAAYRQSSPLGTNIDWTLDCLLNLYKPELITLDNDNLKIYFDQVQYYAPDLIISDLEYFTSYIANVLDTSIWQCSSSLINNALVKNEKYNMGAFKYYAHPLSRIIKSSQKIANLLDNSNGNFVYSHFGDTSDPPQLKEGFEWIRPYHQVGKATVPCQHQVVAGLSHNNKQVLTWLKRHRDCVVFMKDSLERHQGVLVKDIKNQEEYFCNLKNSPFFVCQGQTSFLADAFYNGKHSWIYPDYQDSETLLNSCMSQHLGLGRIVNPQDDFETRLHMVEPSYHQSIKYLHEKIDDLV